MNQTEFIRAATLNTCDTYRKAVAAGEEPSTIVARLALEAGVQNPAIWRRLRSGGVLPQYRCRCSPRQPATRRRKQEPPPRRSNAEIFGSLPPVVYRDPCPRCGVRADIGCNHSHAPLSVRP